MKKVNLIIHLPKQNRLVNLAIPLPVLYLSLIAVVFFLASFSLLNRNKSRIAIGDNRLQFLVKENRLLKERLEQMEQKIEELNKIISELAISDTKLRVAVNMKPIQQDLRKAGMGGLYEDTTLSLLSHYDPKTSKKIGNIEETLDRLLAQTDFQEKSYKEIEKWLKEKAHLRNHTPSIWPCGGMLTSGFGYRRDPFSRRIRMHEGIDIAGPVGTPVHATADGRVVFTGPYYGFGLTVKIDHGYGYKTVYAHLHSIKVDKGDFVKRGDIIGNRGRTGRTTGSHLHYEVRVSGIPVNPLNYIISGSAVVD